MNNPKNRALLMISIAFVVTTTSCDKLSKDYREEFTGDWKMQITEYKYHVNQDSFSLNRSRTYDGSVSLFNDEKDNKIKIEYGGPWALIVEVDKEGTLESVLGYEQGFISASYLYFEIRSSSPEDSQTPWVSSFNIWGERD